ncbi:MAG: radical SAM protein [Candidatus Portnoybacteria bacterium]|nr:radical SAM protein [Candidatus Portnoybacteria bacterium]MDD4982865.1 radical SAM protein [Candidatus Portnoybacteria bacterium]
MPEKKKAEKKEPIAEGLLVLVGFSCNNNCLMCSIRGKEKFYPDRTHHDLIGDLKQGREEGFNGVEFTGGETTLRRDIFDLVAAAKDIGYQTIALSTNGRLLGYPDFCQKIVAAGLNKVTFSLLGPDKKTHEALTRVPGSFGEILAGIENIKKFPPVHLNISSVISRLNHKSLEKFGAFVRGLGVKHWYLLDLIPDGNAKKFYDILAVRLAELAKELNSLASIAGDFKELGFFDFPLCVFSPEIRSLKNVCLVNAKKRAETSYQVGYDPKRIEKNEEGIFADAYRENIAICAGCRYYKECGGIWREYLNRYGGAEIKKLAAKHGCLN